ncbi:MAG: phosphoribosylglycinamide formyltransferase [Oscillospiraceae bacterium]|nr:phosphoribosylglycinamide formyltransferase [Oscillospiraceae bacterium]
MCKKTVNIAVLVSGGGTNLQALIDAGKSGALHSGTIKLVISDTKGAYALERAEAAGIKTAIVPKEKGADNAGLEKAILSLLEENGIELIVLAGFMTILSKDFVSRYEKRIINVHPSLIPAFCGAGFYGLKVHEAALAYGVKVTGATVHFVNEVADGGEIILQKAVKVLDGDTPERLQKRVMRLAEWKILPAATETVCEKILEGRL